MRKDGTLYGEREIIQFQLDGKFLRTFPSIRNASEVTGILESALVKCLSGKTSKSFGSVWKYRSEFGAKLPSIIDVQLKISGGHHNIKPIAQYDLDGKLIRIFNTIAEAAKNLNVDVSNVKRCARGKSNQIKGFIFRKLENFPNGEAPQILDVSFLEKRNESKRKRVLQYDPDGKLIGEWSSAKVAAKAFEIAKETIQDACTGKTDYAIGCVWRYDGDKLNLPEE